MRNILDDSINALENKVFLAISEKDKNICISIQAKLQKLQIPVWSMFRSDGTYATPAAESHREEAFKYIDNCCLFIVLITKNYLNTTSPKHRISELQRFKDLQANNKGNFKRKFLYIYLDNPSDYQFVDDFEPFKPLENEIYLCLNSEDLERSIKKAIDSIAVKYFELVKTNAKIAMRNLEQSYCFLELANACISNSKTEVNTVTDDINNSVEVDTNALQEMHVVTNDLAGYDGHTYSLMVIASNLLGKTNSDGEYDPASTGVKYFYYYPSSSATMNIMKQDFISNINDFIEKNIRAKQKVARFLRKEYTKKHYLDSYFLMFKDMSVEKLFEHFSIKLSDKQQELNDFLNDDKYCTFFTYSRDRIESIKVPNTFIEWLRGELVDDYSIIENYIEFVHALYLILKTIPSVNQPAFNKFDWADEAINMMKRFVDWQIFGQDLKPREKMCLIDFLLADSNNDNRGSRKIDTWLYSQGDKFDSQVIEKAKNNLVFIPIVESSYIKMAYNFTIFIYRNVNGGYKNEYSWYTNAVSKIANIDDNNIVMLLNSSDEAIGEKFMNAYRYLINSNNNIKQILQKNNSVIID